jgi:hypothetical protein
MKKTLCALIMAFLALGCKSIEKEPSAVFIGKLSQLYRDVNNDGIPDKIYCKTRKDKDENIIYETIVQPGYRTDLPKQYVYGDPQIIETSDKPPKDKTILIFPLHWIED